MIPRTQLTCENIVRLCSGKPEMTPAEEDDFIRQYRAKEDARLAKYAEQDRLNPIKDHPYPYVPPSLRWIAVVLIYLAGAISGWAWAVVLGR